MIAAILLAAGSGQRMQGAVEDKTLVPLNGIPVISYSVRAFLEAGFIDQFTIVYRDPQQQSALAYPLRDFGLTENRINWIQGGEERQNSVRHGLLSLSEDCESVFIHDCARPLVSVAALKMLRQALKSSEGAVLAKPVTDTIKRLPESGATENVALEDLDRRRLWAMETPQAFKYTTILSAYEQIHTKRERVTDDTAALAKVGKSATVLHNPDFNPKLTTPDDLEYFEWLLQRPSTSSSFEPNS